MEAYSVPADTQLAPVLCCQCGVPIQSNPVNMCAGCVRTHIDITEDIPKQAILQFCRKCERYFQPPSEWISCALESKELLSLCLQRLKGLNKLRLVDAGFLWTEPHSKRIKVKLTVQGEVMDKTFLQQIFVVEFTVVNQTCDDCHRAEAQDYWKALVQIRQKIDNKKTIHYLEQLILKHKAHQQTLGIKPIHGGLDFFFASESHARKLVDFFSAVLPCRNQHSKRLLSRDIHSNICNYKFTFSVEIVPVTKDSLVCLSKKMSNQMGCINQLCLVNRITNTVHLIDPTTGQIADVNSTAYWRDPFTSVCDPKQLIEYTVMMVEPVMEKERTYFPGQGAISKKHILADVWVTKTSELGLTQDSVHTRSHLGYVLKPGDTVLGYALSDSNINNKNFEKLNADNIPDIVLVKKFYTRRRKRIWKLKHLAGEQPLHMDGDGNDYDEFINDLEEDVEYRKNVNIYKREDAAAMVSVSEEETVEDAPVVSLEEMLEDLHIDGTDSQKLDSSVMDTA